MERRDRDQDAVWGLKKRPGNKVVPPLVSIISNMRTSHEYCREGIYEGILSVDSAVLATARRKIIF
jgi:hypothetical protein